MSPKPLDQMVSMPGLLKSVRSHFSTVFHVILKKSLNEGLLPKQCKQANVKTLFKKGKRTKCSNYRPQ